MINLNFEKPARNIKFLGEFVVTRRFTTLII
jgi:hypothetical protein